MKTRDRAVIIPITIPVPVVVKKKEVSIQYQPPPPPTPNEQVNICFSITLKPPTTKVPEPYAISNITNSNQITAEEGDTVLDIITGVSIFAYTNIKGNISGFLFGCQGQQPNFTQIQAINIIEEELLYNYDVGASRQTNEYTTINDGDTSAIIDYGSIAIVGKVESKIAYTQLQILPHVEVISNVDISSILTVATLVTVITLGIKTEINNIGTMPTIGYNKKNYIVNEIIMNNIQVKGILAIGESLVGQTTISKEYATIEPAQYTTQRDKINNIVTTLTYST